MLFRPHKNSRRDFLRQLGTPLIVPALGAGASLLDLTGAGFAASDQSGRPPLPHQPGGVFHDVAREAGINATLVCGSKEKNWILEVYGSG